MHLAQDKRQWRAVTNTGDEPSGSTKCGKWLSEELLASQEGLCCIELNIPKRETLFGGP
jgi:hypothetical protein